MAPTTIESLGGVQAAVAWLQGRGVRRLTIDSREIREGDAFIAWPGAAHDARRFIPDALKAGAVACLADAANINPTDAAWAADERVALIPQLKRSLGEIASAFEGQPSERLGVVAFTGTNGKTSSTWWLAQASSLLGERCGLVGTLGVGEPPVGDHPGHWTATGLTTPDPVTLQRSLAEMVGRGLTRAALEASSIGIEEHRLQGLAIRVAVFTNFTQDHLDYHGTLERYWQAKRRLFDWSTLRAAVVDIDDPRGAELARTLQATGWSTDSRDVDSASRALWTTGFGPQARLRATAPRQSPHGMVFELIEGGGAPHAVQTAFIGHFNVRNLLGVVAALRALGHALPDILAVLPRLVAVPGRLQRCGAGDGPMSVIDYAHTPDALEKALEALRPLAQARGGRLWCVFGCGGDRDRSKRPLMGAIAERLADRVVLTSDNPRRESPAAILADIRQGLYAADRIHQEVDRAEALRWALCRAGDRDVLLVAGKGHEDYQEIDGVRHPSRDTDLVEAGLQARAEALAPPMATVTGVAHELLPQARVVGSAADSTWIRRVHTDTRSLRPGDLYVALKGERFDGHDFIEAAQAAGAAAVLAEQLPAGLRIPALIVPDALQALQDLARAWRAALDLPVIAVTGSNGKTTVTQMTASILRAWLGPQAGGTRGNLNNHIGVPLTVLALRATGALAHRAAVVELGMNHPGEIARLASIAQPTVALVNNAQREHQEFMHTVEAVALENGSVLQALPPDGVAVFPADAEQAPLWDQLAQKAGVRNRWRFAFDELASVAEWAVQADGGLQADTPRAQVLGRAAWDGAQWRLALHTPMGPIRTSLRLPGRHNLHNAVAAAAVALAAGAPLVAVAQGLADFEPVQGRSMVLAAQRGGQPLCLIDDSYNANPDSVRAAIDLLTGLPGPRALVLGDMGEVGDQGPAFHAEVGAHARARGLNHLWCVGEASRAATAAAGGIARHFASVEALIAALPELPPVASMLVKGSRFMRMERVVQALHPRQGGH